MPLAYLFWTLMLLSLFAHAWYWRNPTSPYPWGPSLLMFALFFVLGWQVFGSAIK